MSKNVTLSMNKFVSQLSLAMAVDVMEAEEPEVDMELLLPLLAVKYQVDNIKIFLDSNVSMLPDKNQDKNTKLFQDRIIKCLKIVC